MSQSNSGLFVSPDTLHVSVPSNRTLLSDAAHVSSQPISAIWRTEDPMSALTWWMTRFVAGIDGEVAVETVPRAVSSTPIPGGSTLGLASISGYIETDGTEITNLFWSERSSALPVCPNSSTISVTWKRAYSDDLGATWQSTETIDSDSAWDPCPASSDAAANSDRPDVLPHRGMEPSLAPWSYFMAINKNIGGVQTVVVWRYISGTGWVDVDYSDNAKDAFGQSLALHTGKYVSSTTTSVLGVVWREDDGSGNISTRGVTAKSFGDWDENGLSSGTTAAFADSVSPTAVGIMQTCLYGDNCPSGVPGYPDFPLVGAWVQAASGGQSEIFVRDFTHE